MSRHRKVDVRTWGDAKFRSLTRPQPNGQSLWIYLLTGPHTTSIPGLCTAGEAGLAEALEWPLKGFQVAFREIIKKGMAEFDSESRVLWIPNAVIYNPPESVNVVKSWRPYWDEVPECELKAHAFNRLKAFLEGYGKGFAEGFAQACSAPRATPKAYQEQEQEQEQEQDYPLTPKGDLFDEFWKAYPSVRKQGKGAALRAWKAATKKTEASVIVEASREYAASPVGQGQFAKAPATWLNQECWNDDRKAWQRSNREHLDAGRVTLTPEMRNRRINRITADDVPGGGATLFTAGQSGPDQSSKPA